MLFALMWYFRMTVIVYNDCIQSALWILMGWCFSTRASKAVVLSTNSCLSSCLWGKNNRSMNNICTINCWYHIDTAENFHMSCPLALTFLIIEHQGNLKKVQLFSEHCACWCPSAVVGISSDTSGATRGSVYIRDRHWKGSGSIIFSSPFKQIRQKIFLWKYDQEIKINDKILFSLVNLICNLTKFSIFVSDQNRAFLANHRSPDFRNFARRRCGPSVSEKP